MIVAYYSHSRGIPSATFRTAAAEANRRADYTSAAVSTAPFNPYRFLPDLDSNVGSMPLLLARSSSSNFSDAAGGIAHSSICIA